MGIYLTSNKASVSALRGLNNVTFDLTKSLQRLSTGFKINSAADGAAELTMSEGLRSQIRGSQAAQQNVQQGISMLNTADSALQLQYGSLQRIRELAVQAANGTVTDYTSFNNEIAEQVNAINQISNGTGYNGTQLLDGSLAGAAFNIQSGPDSGDTINLQTAFADSDTTALGVTTVALASAANANTLIGEIDAAMNTLNGQLNDVGGLTNQLQNQNNILSIAVENYSAAEASIRNTDIAQETATLTRLQIQQQASAAALAQANSMPAIALQLLGGI